jgi:hypothetical protein
MAVLINLANIEIRVGVMVPNSAMKIIMFLESAAGVGFEKNSHRATTI